MVEGLNLWNPENGVAPPTMQEEIVVYEQLAHFVEVLAELHDRVNEERLAMGAVVDSPTSLLSQYATRRTCICRYVG